MMLGPELLPSSTSTTSLLSERTARKGLARLTAWRRCTLGSVPAAGSLLVRCLRPGTWRDSPEVSAALLGASAWMFPLLPLVLPPLEWLSACCSAACGVLPFALSPAGRPAPLAASAAATARAAAAAKEPPCVEPSPLLPLSANSSNLSRTGRRRRCASCTRAADSASDASSATAPPGMIMTIYKYLQVHKRACDHSGLCLHTWATRAMRRRSSCCCVPRCGSTFGSS